MESNYPDPKLSLQPFDPDVFQRVWNRVMPDQEHSPIAVDAPTLPAVPTLSPAPEEAPEPAPEVPLTCLGEGSQRYVQAIRDMMEQTQGFLRTLQRLSRRSAGRPARVLSALSADLRRDLRRLSTAHFLITGERYPPLWTRPCAPSSSSSTSGRHRLDPPPRTWEIPVWPNCFKNWGTARNFTPTACGLC